MQCERLLKLTKTWYLNVQNETMAPARMISFIKQHAETCEICLADPDLQEEITKIAEIVLPESKIPRAIRFQENDEPEIPEKDEENSEEDIHNEGEDLEDEI